MKTSDIPTTSVSMWKPETSPYILGLLGKLIEECGELSSIAARCIIQGLDEANPTTLQLNREALQDEIADVASMARFVSERLELDLEALMARAEKKRSWKTPWFDWLKEQGS